MRTNKSERFPYLVVAGLFCLAMVVTACAALTSTLKDPAVSATVSDVEKHGAAFETCAKHVVDDAVITGANVVLQAEHAGMTVDFAAHALQLIAAQEAKALSVCAAGGTPDRLTQIPDTTPDAGSPGTDAGPSGTSYTAPDMPTTHI